MKRVDKNASEEFFHPTEKRKKHDFFFVPRGSWIIIKLSSLSHL